MENLKLHNALQVIVGLGKTGLSCIRTLAAQGANIAVTDSREQPPGLDQLRQEFPEIPVTCGYFSKELCAKAQRLIVSPGVSLQEPAIATAIDAGIPAIGDIELFVQVAKAPVIAITGSNGKSTVTTLVGEMAKAANLQVKVGGNLGTPALDLLSDTEPDLYVLELSSFQLETTYSLRAVAAVILNLSEDHMDRYASMEAYLQAKLRIYQNCETAIINRDDRFIPPNTLPATLPLISFGLDEPNGENFGLRKIGANSFLAQGSHNLLDVNELKIKGRHQQANALAALALGTAAGIALPAMLASLREFKGLSHRCQWVGSKDDIHWFNDSKATNVGAALATLEGLGSDISGKLIVIAGGLGKNADFHPLAPSLRKYARQLILIGKDAPLMATALENSIAITYAHSLNQAVQLAQQAAKPGDVVVLAPACASFDMFTNFEQRGDLFMAAVRSYL